MAPEEESNPQPVQPEPAGLRGTPRRDRPPGRSRRGRGRRRPQKPSTSDQARSPHAETPPPLREGNEVSFELAQHNTTAPEPLMAAAAEVPAPLPFAPEPHPFQRASPASVQQAIDEVSGVIDTLRGALEEMEEVLEMLEVLERQSSADEQEIESLRRALRQMHRPREGGHPPHR